MEKGKRELLQRGSADFPFANYRFRFSKLRKVTPVHWHPEQEILYVTEGALDVTVGKELVRVKQGQVCIVPSNAIHCVQLAQAPTRYHAFVFDYAVLHLPEQHFFQKEIIAPLEEGKRVFPLLLTEDAEQYTQAIPLLEILCKHSTNDQLVKLYSFQALIQLFTLLSPLLEEGSNHTGRTDNHAVKLCLDYLQNHYTQKITLEQLAAIAHLHPNYICKLFREYTGQTVFQHLLQLRIDNAAHLLLNEGYTVAQAAEACGFESLSFFSRKFKELMGISPQGYKKQHLQSKRSQGERQIQA